MTTVSSYSGTPKVTIEAHVIYHIELFIWEQEIHTFQVVVVMRNSSNQEF